MRRAHDRNGGNRRERPKALVLLLCSLLLLPVTGVDAEETVVRYTIEVGAFRRPERARAELDRLRRQLPDGPPARIERHPPYHAVRFGLFASAAEAAEVLARLQALGWRDAWIAATQVAPAEPASEGPGLRTDAGSGDGAAPPPLPTPPPPEPSLPEPEPAPPAAAAASKRLVATPLSGEPLTLDGKLDEAAWAEARFATDFQQKLERGGGPASERTEVAFLYDDEALYVGARVHLRDPSQLRAPSSRRDDAADADRLIVSLDTYRNRQTAYNFGVTAGGSQLDYYQAEDVFELRDYAFDPVWDARAAPNGGGWTAEMRIPFSSLRFHAAAEQVWGVNVQRVSPAQRLYAFWVVVPGNETGWASRFGELVGIQGVEPGRRIALVPYASGQSVRAPEDGAGAGAVVADEGDMEWRYGGDLLVDLTPNLALEATFNPDFGQIESDPAVVNLTAFEVFLPERRPFFVEGSDLLRGPGPRYFYSRRIGAPPHSVGELEDLPESTTIPGAAKLIGRLPDGRSVAALVALTEEESARLLDPGTGSAVTVPVEPRTFFGVARLQKDFGAGSRVGLIATGVDRGFPEDGSLSDLLPQRAWAGGVDWALRFGGQSHELGGYLGGSLVEGDAAAIARLQGSSARYYQRPDADHVELDLDATRLSGYTGQLRLDRIEGAWRWGLSAEARSPGFEINDAGAMATADDLVGFGHLAWGRPTAGGPFHRVDLSASMASGWNFGGVRQFTSPSLNAGVVWRNFWRSYLRVTRELEALSDSFTRGGPLMATPAGWSSRFGLSTNDARLRVFGLDGTFASDDLGSSAWSALARMRMRTGEHLTFSLAPGYERGRDARQYVVTMPAGREATFGQRYVFGELDRSTLFVRLRAGLSLTPRLGLDLYVEPFAASGSYARLGELLAPRTSDLLLYGTEGTTITRGEDGSWQVTDGASAFTIPNPDFDVVSLRGNAVLRWEYAPGSNLYFVWTHNRAEDDVVGAPVGAGDLLDAFSTAAYDVFAVKASYRLDVGSWR